MKKVFLSLGLALSILSAEMTISDTITSSKDVDPDSLTKSISLNLKSNHQEEIVKDFEQVLKKAKKFSHICKGGEYGIRADYSYNKGNREFKGYMGSMNFACTFNDVYEFEPFMNEIINPLDDKFKKNISPTKWVVSKELQDNTLQELKLENLKKAEELAKLYQQGIIQRRCIVSNISLDNTSQKNTPVAMLRSAQVDSTNKNIELENPIKQKSSIVVKSSVKFDCR
ncbi:MAG: SIMPL domain-containing protein [Campylobacterales bacterium]